MNVRSTSRLHLLEPHHKVESALPWALPGILKDQAVEAPVPRNHIPEIHPMLSWHIGRIDLSDFQNDAIRNLAIIAHVDHGKTTLVDALLKQGQVFRAHQQVGALIMDTNPLERERGITILAKNASVSYGSVRINVIDTPGHADFSGEVERVMNMADGCLLLVDAVDGPMPQTTYVLRQALQQNVTPMVVINKIDRPEARMAEVVGMVQDLFLELATSTDQLDFPVLYASARQGYATTDPNTPGTDMQPLFEAILDSVPPPTGDPSAPLQMLVAALDYDNHLGQVAVGRITNGTLKLRDEVALLGRDAGATTHNLERIFVFHGMERVDVSEAHAGDIVAVTGPEGVSIGDTLASPEEPRGSAVYRHQRADGTDDLRGQHLALHGPRGYLLHFPQSPRTSDERTADQRQPAGGNHRQPRLVRRRWSGRVAPVHPGRDHAP